MKKTSIALIILCISCRGFNQDLTPRIDTLLKAYSKLHKFNGTALVARNGIILLDKGYGFRNAEAKVLHDQNSIFQIGSVTKQFTTAIILKLQQENKIDVREKLSKYFPTYPKGDSITIEQLMLHISGIYSYTDDRDFMQNEVAKPTNREKLMARFQDKPLTFSPGTNWKYSNSAYLLLGYIIEEVTKKPYEQVVREYIFTPLKMSHSGFDFTHLTSNEKSTGYFVLNDREILASPIVDSSVAFSAGAIYSTTGDLFRWHKSLQNNTILSKVQQEKAYTPVRNKYGYGWLIDSIAGKRMVSHGGGIHGFSSNFSRVPEDDICIILLSNSSSPVLNEITNSIYAILYNKPYEIPKERKSIDVPEEKLKEYTGEYEINPSLNLKISIKDGQLLAEPTGQRSSIIYAERDDYFFVKDPDVQLQFTRNIKNEIDGFILFQGGGQTKCRKIK